MPKLMRKSFPQNFVIFRYFRLPVRYHTVCISARRNGSPMVSETNRKW
jgi:hypothetical protein